MDHRIVDRRKNPGRKSAGNRERFMRRSKQHIRKSIHEGLKDRSITSDEGHTVNIPKKGIGEPMFGNDGSTGEQNHVITGNTDYDVGDLLQKPQDGEGGGGSEGSPDGEGEDDFAFDMSLDEYYDILFEGLELPDLLKKGGDAKSFTTVRSGYKTDGTPSGIDLNRTMKRSITRRLALKKPKEKRLEMMYEELETLTDEIAITRLKKEIEILEKRVNAIPYIDNIDLRYRNFKKLPKPKHQALMVCLMDVSASMGQYEKDLAKRFYILLHLFLQKKYENVDIIFVRHHTKAKECDEEEFFYSKESGGTVISSGMELVNQIIEDRYPPEEWNIYISQVSDGDNFTHDNQPLEDMINKAIMPKVQHFYYVETVRDMTSYSQFMVPDRKSDVWKMYEGLSQEHSNFSVKKILGVDDVYSVFRELFTKDKV